MNMQAAQELARQFTLLSAGEGEVNETAEVDELVDWLMNGNESEYSQTLQGDWEEYYSDDNLELKYNGQ